MSCPALADGWFDRRLHPRRVLPHDVTERMALLSELDPAYAPIVRPSWCSRQLRCSAPGHYSFAGLSGP